MSFGVSNIRLGRGLAPAVDAGTLYLGLQESRWRFISIINGTGVSFGLPQSLFLCDFD